MAVRVGINGFGRIGRMVFRHLMESLNGEVEVVGINDIGELDNLAYLLCNDSIQRRPKEERIEARDGHLIWGDTRVRFTQIKDPRQLPWAEAEADVVVEATGRFMTYEGGEMHLEAGARSVLLSAPAKGDQEVTTICPGVNDGELKPEAGRIISLASCTTNALAPVAKVLNDRFGIEQGALTTTHAYTASQKLVDAPASKWRRGRAAGYNIVPTTTGAAIATTRVLPELAGKMDGMALRVPVLAGSIIDFVVSTREKVSVEAVNRAFEEAAETDALRGILKVSHEELVSADIVGSSYSSIVDAPLTMCFGDRLAKVFAWYDNEWGYSKRVAETAVKMGEGIR